MVSGFRVLGQKVRVGIDGHERAHISLRRGGEESACYGDRQHEQVETRPRVGQVGGTLGGEPDQRLGGEEEQEARVRTWLGLGLGLGLGVKVRVRVRVRVRGSTCPRL